MYYKSVNRGLSLTAPGVYALVIVFISGLIAVNTGINALFLFLAAGLSLIVVSGLLSESAIKNYHISGYIQQTTDSNKPFELLAVVENKHPFAPIYGIECHAIRSIPKSIILPHKIKESYGQGNVISIAANSSKTISIAMSGMDRGLYQKIQFMARTNLPFGMIDKFKIIEAKGHLAILPEVIPELYDQIKNDYRKRVAQQDTEREFYSHKNYSTSDSARHIDWKKSAGKPMRQWVQKEYRSEIAEFGILIRTDWDAMQRSTSEQMYEQLISMLRTACDVIKDASRKIVIEHDTGNWTAGYFEICNFLAEIPPYAKRHERWSTPDAKPEIKGIYLALHLSLNGYTWGEYVATESNPAMSPPAATAVGARGRT